MKTPYILHLSCILFLYLNTLTGQERIRDTLFSKSYEELNTLFFEWLPGDTAVAKTIADAYIAKGRSEQDAVHIAKGYYYYAVELEPEKGLEYSDTIIALTEDLTDRSYPGVGYLLKGGWYYRKDDYEKALVAYLKAGQYASERNNLIQKNHVRQMIGALKNRSGDQWGALEITREHLNALEKDPEYKKAYSNDPKYGDVYQENIRVTLYNLAIGYLHLMEIDSSKKYFRRGIEESLKYKDTTQYYMLVSGSGSMEYYAGNYSEALDSLDKALPHLADKHNVAMAYYYKGQAYRAMGQHSEAKRMFLTSDSLAGIIDYKFPEQRQAYEYLVGRYREEQQADSQLVYIDKILKLDEKLLKVRALDGEISRKYDTPRLLREKETLIGDLEQKHLKSRRYKILMLIALLLFGIGVIHYYQRQQIYRKRYRKLLSENNAHTGILPGKSSRAKEDPGVSKGAFRNIEEGLMRFEQEKRYTDPDITLYSLAKELQTNSTYLSKVINTTRKMNFSQYIHGLRINGIIQRLKQEERLRSYSIHGIAQEAGYNTSQSFANSFYRHTGIYPSYFLKKLKEEKFARDQAT